MKRIIKDYHHGRPNFMDNELADALKLYQAYKEGNGVTEEQVLERCFTGNHFRQVHLTKAGRPQLVAEAVKALKAANILSFSGGDFEVLYAEVKKAIGGIHNVGLLTLYDTTKMIGHVLGIEPVDYVYTQSGAQKGAKTLLGVNRMGYRVPTATFAKLFPGEKSIHIEDMLCIYKDFYRKGGANKKAASLAGTGCGPSPKPVPKCKMPSCP